jgi:hypothetical protein
VEEAGLERQQPVAGAEDAGVERKQPRAGAEEAGVEREQAMGGGGRGKKENKFWGEMSKGASDPCWSRASRADAGWNSRASPALSS